MAKTLYEKIYDAHIVHQAAGEPAILYIDRHLIHEVTSPQAFSALELARRPVARPDLTLATVDHDVSTKSADLAHCLPLAQEQIQALIRNTKRAGIRLFGLGDENQGIVHIIGPELGFTLPGTTLVCGDSHTATHGAFGALAFGIGTSEVEHVLATQTLKQARLKTMRIECDGEFARGVFAKDLILYLIGKLGTAGGTGYAVEFCGTAIENLSMEARMSVANMSIELGAKVGLIAPDEKTFAYLRGREYAPQGEEWERNLRAWRTLKSDAGAHFDKTLRIDVGEIGPQITYGTNPGQVVAVDGAVPWMKDVDAGARKNLSEALAYTRLCEGQRLEGVGVDVVFIGSCTNGRLEDLQIAASILKGKKIHPKVKVLVVPGSMRVRRAAGELGLDKIFTEAGCEWRLPGCSMCLGMNDDKAQSGQRVASTSNRNFVGRQGRGAITHLMSPASAAAAALEGRICDPRKYL